jgi:hypothetical protein
MRRTPGYPTAGNTYVMVVYASPPLNLCNLCLSPGDRSKLPAFRKLEKLPVSFEGVGNHNLILLSPNPPQLTRFEPSGAHTTHKTSILLIIDFFSNGALRLSPGDRAKNAVPVALQAQKVRSCLCADDGCTNLRPQP